MHIQLRLRIILITRQEFSWRGLNGRYKVLAVVSQRTSLGISQTLVYMSISSLIEIGWRIKCQTSKHNHAWLLGTMVFHVFIVEIECAYPGTNRKLHGSESLEPSPAKNLLSFISVWGILSGK